MRIGFGQSPLTMVATTGKYGIMAPSIGIVHNGLKSYSTSFAATENPISESGVWVNGGATGLDWTNVQTTPGLAFATQTIHAHPPFDDSVACLNLGFHGDQYAQGTIHNASSHSREVELLLRSTITSHSIIQYEVDITQSNGLDLAIWTGPLNTFSGLVNGVTTNVSLADGAVWYAQIVGTVITVKCNSTTVLTYDTSGDATKISSGNPGVGFYGDFEAGSPTANNTLGWSNFSAGEL